MLSVHVSPLGCDWACQILYVARSNRPALGSLCQRWQLALGAGIRARDRMYLFNSVLHFYPRAHGISLDVPRSLAQSLLDTMQKADVQTMAFPLAACREWIVRVFVVLV